MAAFGDRPAREVTSGDVSRFLRSLDKAGLTPRNVNKHRQVLAAMFTYGCRDDTHRLPANPVAGTDKRREDPPEALDYYEVEEVEALARSCAQGDHRGGRAPVDPDERAARARENRQDAEAFRLLLYTGDSGKSSLSGGRTSTSRIDCYWFAAVCPPDRRRSPKVAGTGSCRSPPRPGNGSVDRDLAAGGPRSSAAVALPRGPGAARPSHGAARSRAPSSRRSTSGRRAVCGARRPKPPPDQGGRRPCGPTPRAVPAGERMQR
jgi:hypothetical protein